MGETYKKRGKFVAPFTDIYQIKISQLAFTAQLLLLKRNNITALQFHRAPEKVCSLKIYKSYRKH